MLRRSQGRCENPHCTGQPADVTDRGQSITEVDHIIDLGLGGRDHPSQMVALCPNCHAVKTRGSSRESLRSSLLGIAAERHAAALAAVSSPARDQSLPSPATPAPAPTAGSTGKPTPVISSEALHS
ncbi:HNH endonuclease [Streptomyces sp. NPDC052023]|uniref:HNH endonuclease n=1 Tax=Streptomyces sp. NPDC052023 TaxID=3365681 RepID=UPI0037D72082